MNNEKRKQILARLARVEGQIRGVCKLISEDEPDCEKIAQQMAAARKALDKSSHAVLACMLEKQIVDSANEKDVQAEKMAELISKYA